MTTTEPIQQAADALAFAATYWHDARRVMGDQRGGLPSSAGGFGSGGAPTMLDTQNGESVAIPNVTTTEASALNPQPDESRIDERRARRLIDEIHSRSIELERLVAKYKPTIPTTSGKDPEVGIDWCKSCYRFKTPSGLQHRCEPVGRRKNGTGPPYYKGYCLDCGRFKAAHGFEPPEAWINRKKEHAPRRMSAIEHDRYVAAERARLNAGQRAKRKTKK